MNNTIKLYAFVGMPGAGKSEAAAYLNSKGLPIIRFGDETDIELKNRGWERNPKNDCRLSWRYCLQAHKSYRAGL